MQYIDDAHPEHPSRPAVIVATNPNGTVNLLVTDPDGTTFEVDSAILVQAGQTPPKHLFYVQAD